MPHIKFKYLYLISPSNARALYQGHVMQLLDSGLCSTFFNFFSSPIFANDEGPPLLNNFLYWIRIRIYESFFLWCFISLYYIVHFYFCLCIICWLLQVLRVSPWFDTDL